MQIEETGLEGVLLLTPRRFGDARGWFTETWNARTAAETGVTCSFVQDNQSFSASRYTLRGLHYQSSPHAQDKLVRCTQGAILDVAVDVRLGSPDFGKSIVAELTAENGKQLLVPQGYLHGFLTLVENTEVQYKCSDYYAPACDGAVRWDSVGVDWNLGEITPVLSEKDEIATPFANWQSPFRWQAPTTQKVAA